MNNETHKIGIRKSTRFVNKKLSDLWKVPTQKAKSISGPLRPEELAAALRRLKPPKSPSLDDVFPEFIFHVGLPLKSLFCGFLTSCLRQLKIPRPG